ncbi:hypothetical protein P9272_13650 [Mesorhizobium sp. WSM4976]|uniref:hypothetical protein n=1 Tax=Mesorhizobium sp. WSM4976 TaxID=3038549 RepID=UPI002416F939|nr:hypothetical protein [Mesorhizobium sp. WSM4976]MDG4894617.1 hypothetical protein [Mesorhizobium sp. WSM4976]
MFLYGTKFGDNPTYAPDYAGTIAHENEQRAAAEALWNTTKDLADYRDNSNAEWAAKEEAYTRRNKAIFDATGVQLDNPMKFDVFRLKLEPGAAGLPEPSAPDDIAAQEKAWQQKAAELAREKPQFAGVIAADRPVIEDAYAITKQAEQNAAAAEAQATAAGLGPVRRIGNTLGGGLAGSLRDPLQVATLAAGGGVSSPARALGWRMLDTMLTEGAINGGIEAGLQVATHEYKQRAGVDASLSTALTQVGLATMFGGGFGGLLEGGREVFRLLGREAPEAAFVRAANGEAEPGDFAAIADALGVTPDPERVRLADMAAEQPALDADAFGPPPEGVSPDEAATMAVQALREADSSEGLRAAAIDRIVNERSPVGPAPKRPVSLMQFLASRSVGGIADENGELAAMGLTRKFVPGGGALVRRNGKSLDYAREAAAEAGFFNDLYGDPARATAESTPDDLLRLLRQEAGGEPVFSARNDGGRQFAWLDYERQRAAQAAYRRLVEEVDSAASSLGIDHRLDDATLVRAAELVDENTSPVDALERALDEDYINFADALAERGEEKPDVQGIPFFEEDPGTGAAAGGDLGATRAVGEPGGSGGADAAGGGLSRAGGNEVEEVGLRQPGDTPEPATPEAGEMAALVLTEARRASDEAKAEPLGRVNAIHDRMNAVDEKILAKKPLTKKDRATIAEYATAENDTTRAEADAELAVLAPVAEKAGYRLSLDYSGVVHNDHYGVDFVDPRFVLTKDGKEVARLDRADEVVKALPATERTAAGEQILLEGVKPVSTKEKLQSEAAKPMRGGDTAMPEGGLFDLESRKQMSIWDALPAAKNPDGSILHATHETMIADAERTEFFGDLIASCRD